MRHRVVVTGMGVVSPIGCDVTTFSENLLGGVSGVGPITLFDASSLPVRIAAEVALPAETMALRDRKIPFALLAAEQAWAESTRCGTSPGGGEAGAGAGVSLGLGLELFCLEDGVAFRQPGFVMPETLRGKLTFLQTPSDLCAHLLASRFGLLAPPLLHVSACAAGADAIGYAFRAVASGRRRFVLAGGSDSMVNPLGVAGFCKLGALSLHNEEPRGASRPFDAQRDGFVLGEGAAALVLERLEDARARGAAPIAELAGFGNSFDADEISRPHPEGLGAYLAMRRALDDAGLGPEDVDCISAHGTGTPLNDVAETLAVKRLLGARAPSVPVCAPKSMLGHLIAAAGAVEAVAAIVAMNAATVHPTVNLEHPDPACDLDYVPLRARPHPQRTVLSNSFGFGGQNATLVLRRCDAT